MAQAPQPPYMAPITLANPYLSQANQAEQQAGMNSYNAWSGVQQGQSNLQALQQMQTQLLGNGAYGYTAGGGNDTGTGGYYNPWASIPVANEGQASNPNLPNYNPNTSNLGGAPGYALSGYSPAYTSSYQNTSFLPEGSAAQTLGTDSLGAPYVPGTPAVPGQITSVGANGSPWDITTTAPIAAQPATGDPSSYMTAANTFLAANPGSSLSDPTANFMGGAQPTGYPATGGNATAGGSGYPTFPNAAGVGSQSASAMTPQAPQAPSAPAVGAPNVQQQQQQQQQNAISPSSALTAQQQVQSQVQANTTQGFNPWSLTGEANSRTP